MNKAGMFILDNHAINDSIGNDREVCFVNFFMMQSIGAYTRNMEMQLKWQQKKENNDFTADGSMKLDATARQAEEIRLSQADGSAKFASQIRSKLANGQKLTKEEMEYLEKNDPQTYQKVKAIEAEKKSYEKELKRCKTKEEVQRVRMNHTAASLSAVNSIKNNPAIPEGKKLELIWQEHQKNMALEEITKEFVESGGYAQLPTEAEKAEAEKEMKEAKEAEMGIKDPASDIEEKDPASDETEADSAEKAGSTKKDTAADKAKEAAAHEAVQRSRAALQERRMTRAEAESTPEALKVKRARAKAAYKENLDSQIPMQLYNVKVE